METVLGVDLGTSGIKALIVGVDGQLLGEARADVPSHHERPGWSEQDPTDWWTALAGALDRLSSEHSSALSACRAVGVSGQMHGSVLLDAHGEVLRRAILWNDGRSDPECREVTAQVGFPRLISLAGNRAFPGFTAPKIRWIRKHDRTVFDRIAHLLLPKDYLVHRMTGELATDVSDASGTLLFDIGRRRWSDELCAIWDADPGWLPHAFESSEGVGAVRPEAGLPGLPAGIPVVAGAGDQAAAAVGVGIAAPGETSICVGTSGVVFAQTAGYEPDADGILHAFCHAVAGAWHVMGVMLSAGGALDWFTQTFPATAIGAAGGNDSPFDRVTRAAAEAGPGAGGVVFLPYLAGERCPHPDPGARATWHGMSLGTTYADMARAVLEGIAVGLAECADRIRSAGVRMDRVRVTGGGARSAFLMGLLASALDMTIETQAIDEGSAYGAALLAGIAAGWAPDAAGVARSWERPGEIYRPQDEQRAALEEVKARRLEVYGGVEGMRGEG